jgi:peptide/nickel transport system permease protein
VYAPWVAVYPGVMIAVTVLSINFVGDGLRDAFDPRMTL